LERAIHDTRVTVETGVRVESEDIDDGWDVVVVATGANRPSVSSFGFNWEVTNGFDVFDGAPVGEDVLLFNDNRWVIAHQVAEAILDQGSDLQIVTRDHYPGFRTEQANLPGFVASLQAHGADFLGNSALSW
jgi:hypothetical protein